MDTCTSLLMPAAPFPSPAQPVWPRQVLCVLDMNQVIFLSPGNWTDKRCLHPKALYFLFGQMWPWSVFSVAAVISPACSSARHLHNNTNRAPPSDTLQTMGLLRQRQQTYTNNPESERTPTWGFLIESSGPQSLISVVFDECVKSVWRLMGLV